MVVGAAVLTGCNRPEAAALPQSIPTEALALPLTTAVPQPTATPTPLAPALPGPLTSVEDGDRLLFYGDWEAARQAYHAAWVQEGDAERKAAALLGMGRAYYQLGDYNAALQALQTLIAEYPQSAHQPAAYVALAQVHEALGDYAQAANAYALYLSLRPGLVDSYIQERRGDALAEQGDQLAAIEAYQAALAAPRVGDTLPIEIKIANAYAALGEYSTALVAYQDLYNRTLNEYTRAYLDYQMGQVYTTLGQPDQAYSVYLDAVENYPLSYDSYQALIWIVEAGYPVSEFDRGLVDYFAGQYSLAIAAFDRHLSETTEKAATARYYQAMAYRALGEIEQAIAYWDEIIASYPDDERWDDAWEQKGFTQWAYLDQYDAARQTMLDFVAQAPWHARAAEFLMSAARIAERNLDLEEAVAIWERVPLEYPASGYASRAIFLSAVTRYRLGDFDGARAAFERFLGASGKPGERAAAYFWLGKTYQALGDATGAQNAFRQASTADPTGYYSERARDILLERAAFTPPLVYDLGYDLDYERPEADAWMRETFALAEDVDLAGPGALANDPRLVRGTELHALGMLDEARQEFDSLWQAVRNDPLANYRLADYLVNLGYYRTAIFAAREVLNLNQMDDAATMNAPIWFNHVRFGAYYREPIIAVAEETGFHPLFLYSVVRQESLFAGWVHSSAGARGLMQIIPSTGETLAAQLGWPPDYTAEDLYRPVVSLRLGAEYLRAQREYFDGDLLAALAAYNAGPGNAAIWYQLANGDADLFVEIIRFEETRRYVQGVYEIFSIYRRLYDRTP